MKNDYEMVIGLEVHAELKTNAKIFCGCSTKFGAMPNTQCCPVCMGMPGTLPVLNEQVVRYAVKAGLATNCSIAGFSKQDRKNYFYPDLPKAYQISQFDLPLCSRGFLSIESEQGKKRIGITRIHIEEDAGKLIHNQDKGTFVDYNRCGVPLIEIVSEPDLRSAEEVKNYLKKLRAILLYVNVSDCKMNEGSLRCDVNLSVRKKGEAKLGVRTEMKNLNSFQFIGKAIEYEFNRQVELLEKGEAVVQETRRFDQSTGKTCTMRSKEDADDYRYFPDPDLVPIVLDAQTVEEIKKEIPVLPDERKEKYIGQYQLSAYDAEQLVTEQAVADYFEKAALLTKAPKTLANLILSEIFRLLPAESTDISISPANLAKLADLLENGRINSSTGKRLVQSLWKQDADPEQLVRKQGLEQIRDEQKLKTFCISAIEQNPAILSDYNSGKQKALQALLGKAMGLAGGQADPILLRQILEKTLNSQSTSHNQTKRT